MPGYLIVLGLVSLVVVAMGFVTNQVPCTRAMPIMDNQARWPPRDHARPGRSSGAGQGFDVTVMPMTHPAMSSPKAVRPGASIGHQLMAARATTKTTRSATNDPTPVQSRSWPRLQLYQLRRRPTRWWRNGSRPRTG